MHILDFFCTFVGEMKAKKSANSKVPSRALHAKSRKDSCTNNVHPDVVLDADEALRNILGRLTKLEDEVAPIKTENKELKKRNGYLESQHRQDLAKIKKKNAEICTLKARLDKLEKPKKDSHNSNTPVAIAILSSTVQMLSLVLFT